MSLRKAGMGYRSLKILSQSAERAVTRGLQTAKAKAEGKTRTAVPWSSNTHGKNGDGTVVAATQERGIRVRHLQAQYYSSRAAPLERIPVRGAASDVVDILRYLDGAEDQTLGCTDDVPEAIIPKTGTIEQAVIKIATQSAGDATHGDASSAMGATELAKPAAEEGRFRDDERLASPDEAPRLQPHADGKHRKIIELIADPHALASAFENVKKQHAKSKIFHPQETLDWRWCEQTADELRAGTYAFRPVRRVNIPVLGQREQMRSIRVVNPKDQIVLEAFRAVLEMIYAPLFSPNAFDCKHAAFESVKYGWKGTSWFMDFAVEKSYGATTLKRLKSILSEKIHDQRFLDTLTQMFNAGVIGMDRSSVEEGSILSSILRNIYFQKLDYEVEAIKQEWNTGARRRAINPAYRRLMFFDKRTIARLGANAEQMRREKQHRLAVARKLRISREDYRDSNFTRVKYVRVGDDFLVGVSGSKGSALKIMKRLTTFLQSNLHLPVDTEKTRLGHGISDKTLFMGAYIRVLDPKYLPAVSSAYTRAMAKKRAQTMRVKQQLDDRWTRECRNVVLKCWTVAFEKWRRELGKDGAKRRTVEAATQQLLSLPEHENLQWREKTQDLLHVFVSAALRQGLFPKEEVDVYRRVVASLEQSLAKIPSRQDHKQMEEMEED